MQEYKELFGAAGVLVAFSSYGLYFLGIFRGRVKPHVFSWLVWGTLDAIGFAAQIAGNAGAGAWVLGLSALMCYLIFLLSLFKGERSIVPADWIALGLAVTSMLLWKITSNPVLSVFLITLISVFASFPTYRKSFHRPYEESASVFALNFLKSALSIAALQSYSIITAFYPASLLFINGAIVLMLVIRRKQFAHHD